MEIKFENFINFNKRIGKMIIAGKEGTGKTLLLTAIGIGKMLNGILDCPKSIDLVNDYNRMGYNFSVNYEHCCFSNYNIDCSGIGVPGLKVYSINPYRLGFFREDYETDILPPYSLICLTEGKNILNSYAFDKFSDEYIGWLKTGRQGDIDMVIDSQYFNDICTTFRRLTNRFILCEKEVEHIYDDRNVCVGHKWHIVEWSDDKDVDVFLNSTRKQNCKEYDLVIDKCLFDCYDSKFCKWLHLKGRERQDFRLEHFIEIKTVEDVESYAEEYGLVPPPGFFKNSKIKQKEKNSIEDIEDCIF